MSMDLFFGEMNHTYALFGQGYGQQSVPYNHGVKGNIVGLDEGDDKNGSVIPLMGLMA